MKLATGTVVDGKVVIQGSDLPEGTTVAVIALGEAETFTVPPDLEQDLQESMGQADRGETIPLEEVLARLRAL